MKMILYPEDLLGLNSEESINFQLFAAIVCDHLWMIRNKVRVEGIKSNLVEIVRQILRAFEEHKQAGRELIKKPSRDPKWYPPPTDWVKLNFEAPIREGYSFVAVVSRDHEGNLIEVWTKKISLGSSICGEAEAAWYAIRRVVAKGFNKTIIGGDASNVLELCKNQAYLLTGALRVRLDTVEN